MSPSTPSSRRITRINLLTNGDFEDVSNLSPTDQFELLATYDGFVDHTSLNPSGWAPGWTYGNAMGQGYEAATSNGLQCMLWAPPGQPIQGRITELTTADPSRHLTGGRSASGWKPISRIYLVPAPRVLFL